jgi:hypothetical protein
MPAGSIARGAANWTRETNFFYRGCELFAVRHKQWKLHLNATPPQTQPPAWDFASVTKASAAHGGVLFQIENDPSERFPLLDDSAVTAAVVQVGLHDARTPAQFVCAPFAVPRRCMPGSLRRCRCFYC